MDAEVEAYRRSQMQVGAAVALAVQQTLPGMVDLDNLLPSFEAWVQRITPLVVAGGARTSDMARPFYQALRASEGFTRPMPTWQRQVVSPEAVRSSLYATAGQALQEVERYRISAPDTYRPGPAVKRAQIAAAGAALRHTMNAGRNSVIETTRLDEEALGCVYITRGDEKVCYWCKMLSSRGPVYKGRSFLDSDRMFDGPGTAKVHDHCRCVLVPIKNLDSARMDASLDLWNQWKAVNHTPDGRIRNSGKAAVKAWRRHVEGRGDKSA